MSPKQRALKVRCPVCGKTVQWGKGPYRPFCSERCKLIDLGEWITEGYRISAPADESASLDSGEGNGGGFGEREEP